MTQDELTEEWITDIFRENTGGVGEIYPEPAIRIITKRHSEIVAKLRAELAESIPKARVQGIIEKIRKSYTEYEDENPRSVCDEIKEELLNSGNEKK